MKRYLFILIMLLISDLAINQTVTWDRTYDNDETDRALSIAPTIDNGYIVAGTTGSLEESNTWILKLNEFGDTIWSKIYGESTFGGAFSIIETSDGNFIFTGYKSPTNNYFDFYIYILKLDEDGNTIWDYSYSGGNRVGTDIIETIDEGFIILGRNYTFVANEIILIKLNQDGQLVWDKNYNFQGSPYLMYEIIETQDSGFMLIGEKSGLTDQDIWIMKTDQNGDSTWSKTINYQGNDVGYSIKQLENGDFIIAANSGTNEYGQNHLLTYKLYSSGEIDWVKSYFDNAFFSSSSIISTSDGNFFTTGRISQQVGVKGIFLFKQNSFGDSTWLRTFERGAYGGSSEIHQTGDDGYIISGYVSNNGSGSDKDAWVLKLNESGLVKIKSELHLPQIHITLFPNPANDFVFCRFDTPIISNTSIDIKIYSLDFKLQKSFTFQLKNQENNILPLSISGLSSGIYIIRVELDKEIITKKILISKK